MQGRHEVAVLTGTDLQHSSELGVAIGHMRQALSQSIDDLAKGQQPLVDGNALCSPVGLCLGASQPLTSSQIHQMHLGAQVVIQCSLSFRLSFPVLLSICMQKLISALAMHAMACMAAYNWSVVKGHWI